jgi:hypothetical protein
MISTLALVAAQSAEPVAVSIDGESLREAYDEAMRLEEVGRHDEAAEVLQTARVRYEQRLVAGQRLLTPNVQ